MTNNEVARQYARDGGELGDLKARLNTAHIQARAAEYLERVEALSAEYKRLMAAGETEQAYKVKIEASTVINQFYGVL